MTYPVSHQHSSVTAYMYYYMYYYKIIKVLFSFSGFEQLIYFYDNFNSVRWGLGGLGGLLVILKEGEAWIDDIDMSACWI